MLSVEKYFLWLPYRFFNWTGSNQAYLDQPSHVNMKQYIYESYRCNHWYRQSNCVNNIFPVVKRICCHEILQPSERAYFLQCYSLKHNFFKVHLIFISRAAILHQSGLFKHWKISLFKKNDSMLRLQWAHYVDSYHFLRSSYNDLHRQLTKYFNWTYDCNDGCRKLRCHVSRVWRHASILNLKRVSKMQKKTDTSKI